MTSPDCRKHYTGTLKKNNTRHSPDDISASPLQREPGPEERRRRKLGTKEGGNGSHSRKREEQRESDSRKREETSPFLTTRKPPGEMGKYHQCKVPNQRARRNVGRWKGQSAGLCPVPKTCPTSWLHNRRILEFC